MDHPPDTPDTGRAVHRFAILTAVATFLLIVAGGLVTSTGSGLAVPDWPLSYGMLFPPMVGGIFYEHGHRMIAGLVGILTVGLAAWLGFREPRRWVRRLGYLAVAAIFAQAILGGVTVLWFLPTPVSVGHAGLAMAFFALTVTLAVVTSPGWKGVDGRRPLEGAWPLPRLALLATVAAYLQALLGAAVRHTGSGLACPDFPLCGGRLLPPAPDTGVVLQLAHRGGAIVVAVLVAWTLARVLRRHRSVPALALPAALAAILVAGQIVLGAAAVWTELAVTPTTAHVAGGALTLVALVTLTLSAYRRYTCPGSAWSAARTGGGAPLAGHSPS